MTSRCQTFAKLRNRRNRLLGSDLHGVSSQWGLFMGSDLHFTQLIRQTSTFTVGGNQSIVRTYSLHIRVRAFTAFGDEAVDTRGDNGQRY